MKLNKAAFQKWQRWMEAVETDIKGVVNNADVFDKFTRVVKENYEHLKSVDGVFVPFVFDCYDACVAMAIRRHVKVDKSISLMRVIREVQRCARQFTFDFYLEQFPIDPDYINWQKLTFGQFSTDGQTISEETLEQDCTKLANLSKNILDVVDKKIAHLDKNGCDAMVTFRSLRQFPNTLNELTCRYLSLITGRGVTLKAYIPFDWEQVFRSPLARVDG